MKSKGRSAKRAFSKDIRRMSVLMGLTATLYSPACLYANTTFGGVNNIAQSVNQTKFIKGKVVDEQGESMIGVSIKVKGTNMTVVTDLDGNFSVKAPVGSSIELSYIGYKNLTASVRDENFLNLKMEPNNTALNEVVVIGYGTVKKRDLTGAITTIKGEDIALNPGSNPMQALQGKVAGLDITKESGQAGSGVNMQLRGNRSFTASGNPTFIIDGMPGDYSTLNPNDIESIEVLKDASSTAVYGAAGANGVIIITTKSGAVGKTNVNFNAFVGVNGWSTVPKMRSGDSYIQTIRDANKATGNWSSTDDDERVMDGLLGSGAYAAHTKGEYIDWAKEVLRNNLVQNYSMSASGGTEKTKAYFSLNFSDEAGQYKGDDYKLYSSTMRIDHTVKPWLKVGVNAQMSYVHQNKAYSDLQTALTAVPLGTLRDSSGKLNVSPSVGGTNINILLDSEGGVYKNQEQDYKLYFNPYIEIHPMKGMSYISRIGGVLTDSRVNYFQGIGSYQYYMADASAVGTNANVYASVTEKRNLNYKWENILTYNFQIHKDHDITLTAVTSWNHDRYDYNYMKETNITDNSYLWYNMGNTGNANSTVSSTYNMSKGFGLVGRVAYSYLGRYLFSASARRDGSSKLASDHRWETFPAVSLGWRISDEKFMEGTHNWLDNLKLRLGYGVTGTANINPYSSQSNLEQSTTSFSGNVTNVYNFSQNYTNKNLTWEKSYNANIGVDMSVLKGRIDFTGDLYNTTTKGVIWSRQLPVTNGAYSASSNYITNMNICKTKNTGIELALNTRNIVQRDFKWSSTVTFNYNKEKIMSLIDGTSNNIANGDYSLSLGHPVKSYYHYKIDGVWQTNEAKDAAVFGAQPGDLKINVPGMVRESEGTYSKKVGGVETTYTADNKYSVSGNDYQVLGHNSPDWTLGFQNVFTYKSFDLNIFTYVRWGQMIKYSLLESYDPTGKGNFPKDFNYWTTTNASNDFPAINANKSLSSYTGYYALQYVDGSFIKIKNVTLGYTMPAKLLQKAGISKCRFYGTITNPFVFAKSHLLKNYDPEMNGNMNYPLTKQLVFGVNMSF